MKGQETLFSKKSDDWSTPVDFYNQLDKEFKFDFDPCPLNHDISKWDGLGVDWKGNIFVNPPYSDIKKWLQKAHTELEKEANTIVFLVPSRTDTKWFHEYVYGKAELRFIKGRLKFGNAEAGAPFPSMLAIFKK